MLFRVLFLIFAAILHTGIAKLFTNPAQLSHSSQYDFIVIGSGPGGSVIASRLSENPKYRVLVVEAGGNDDGVIPIEIPFLANQLSPNTSFTWNYTTVPQTGLDGREVPYPRGRILGGSSSINFMVYTRGSEDDFNRFAQVTHDDGWSWNALQPFLFEIEKLVPPADGHNTTGQIEPSLHGKNGLVSISLPGAATELDSRIFQTTQQLSEFPFNEDMNSGNTIGIGWTQSTIGDGERSSSAKSYLHPFASRSNLDLLVQTQVTKLIQTDTEDGLPVFRGVQMAGSSNGPRHVINATREVILSAGSINSPQVLLLSGIGPQEQLSALHIESIVDIPDVGSNLQDHALLPNPFNVNSTHTVDALARNATLADGLIDQWEANRTGLFTDGPGNLIGWLRLPSNASIFESAKDPSAGMRSGHFQFLFLDNFVSYTEATPATGFFMTVFTNVVSPASRGSVTLSSADPFAFPAIDPGFLTTKFDIFTMREAVRSLQRFVAASAWKGFVLSQAGAFANVTTDAQIDAWARANTATIWHPVGTTSMSPFGAKTGVVNPDLTMKAT